MTVFLQGNRVVLRHYHTNFQFVPEYPRGHLDAHDAIADDLNLEIIGIIVLPSSGSVTRYRQL